MEKYMEKVRETLEVYDECYLMLDDNDNYRVSVSITLSKTSNEKLVKTFKAKDVFTEEELVINYVKNFKSYPIKYKGAKDYLALKKISEDTIIKMIDGNIIFEF